jgi:hypothetical protein
VWTNDRRALAGQGRNAYDFRMGLQAISPWEACECGKLTSFNFPALIEFTRCVRPK